MIENSPEPKHISEILIENISNATNDERKKEAKKKDLESEIAGLTEQIADIQTDMRLTGDPALPQALDNATEASMLAQREFREQNDEKED
jgi:hypothetical protein